MLDTETRCRYFGETLIADLDAANLTGAVGSFIESDEGTFDVVEQFAQFRSEGTLFVDFCCYLCRIGKAGIGIGGSCTRLEFLDLVRETLV